MSDEAKMNALAAQLTQAAEAQFRHNPRFVDRVIRSARSQGLIFYPEGTKPRIDEVAPGLAPEKVKQVIDDVQEAIIQRRLLSPDKRSDITLPEGLTQLAAANVPLGTTATDLPAQQFAAASRNADEAQRS